jgi:hypothetical protein
VVAGAVTAAVVVVAWLLVSTLAHPAWAGPGAHGPNGEHLDAPAAAAATGASVPRIEAQSELFELVGTLAGGELSFLIDRYASNEPLLRAQVEVESGGLKAQARFHADLGDYAVDDAALLKKLAAPGEHPLVITIVAGEEMDLLEGVLRTAVASGHDEHHAHGWRRPGLVLAGAGLLLGAGLAGWQLRRRRVSRSAGTQDSEGARA